MRFRLCESIEYDSEGNPLSEEQIKFFKNSKVRDSQGRLLVCYHSSVSDFDTFDKSKIGSGLSQGKLRYGKGFYFSSKKGTFVEPRVRRIERAFYLNIKNPYVTDGFSMKDFDVIEYRKNDGIIAYQLSGNKEFIAFDPNQIKSITKIYK
jgi:hypothetical protein